MTHMALSLTRLSYFTLLLILTAAFPHLAAQDNRSTAEPPGTEVLLSRIQQITFAGRRAGEAYFSPDGGRIVFQSERSEDNPFYQIYTLDLHSGETRRVSPGWGKTTCGWIHRDGRVLFASTHHDPDTRREQQAELQRRASGKQRRYQWDYDEDFELYLAAPDFQSWDRLTNARGYDAEGSLSPDGEWVVFSSNRHAFTEKLDPLQAARFEADESTMLELYRMKIDGSSLERLTTAPGYDGGPFYSPTGKQICFRRFSEDGARAEVYTMDADGGNERQLTHLGAMSWAPFYHPSGQYLIFTTNLQGFANFELYLVDREGKHAPVRVTSTDGFDGLAAFSPDGRRLAWTSNRTSDGSSQIFFADWNHELALQLLSENGTGLTETTQDTTPAATAPAIRSGDARRHVEYLASDALEGRLTGSAGARLATDYVAREFERLGLKPAGEDGSFFENFEFTAGVSLGNQNTLRLASGRELAPETDWRPLAFSKTGHFEESPVIFAGYGIVAPERDGQSAYDSYAHLDASEKWVMFFRYVPEDVEADRRQFLSRHASLRYKAMVARDRGARGILVVSGPRSRVKKQLVALDIDASLAGSGIAAVSLTDATAQALLDSAGKKLDLLQKELDGGDLQQGFPLPGVTVEAHIDILQEKRTGRNVVARLRSRSPEGTEGGAVIVGAHIDHLGRGLSGSSLARPGEKGEFHNGADDNASGVAGMLEIAEFLVAEKQKGSFRPRRDVVFAAWSGEELGILGSQAYVSWLRASHNLSSGESLAGEVAAYLNLDMVGRLRDRLSLQGVGSSSIWPSEIERRNVPVGLPIAISEDSYLPTDATSFYLAGVPVLSAFTGAHEDYHTPRDTSDKINYSGIVQVARLMALITRSLAESPEAPDYVRQERPDDQGSRRGLRVYLGTIPDYVESERKGVPLSGVVKGGPAEEAGVRGGDLIVELAGRKIENIYDYTYAIEALKIGQAVSIVILRDGERLELSIVPGSRE